MRHDSLYYRLTLLTICHASVDACANAIGPLMIVFAAVHVFSPDNAKLLPAVMAAAGSLTQPLVGLLADRGVPRGVLLAGPAFAAGGLGLAMLAGHAPLVIACLVICGLGVAFFHPEAAVLASIGAGKRTPRVMSIFLFGGTMGLWLGPVVCGYLLKVTSMGMAAYLLAVPGLVLGLYLSRSSLARLHPHLLLAPEALLESPVPPAGAAPSPAPAGLNWPLISLTLQATLRALAMGAVAVVVPWWGLEHHLPIDQIGNLSGLFLFSGGVGMLLVGLLCKPRWEIPLLLASALAGIAPIALLGRVTTVWQATICIAAGGVLLNGLNAVVVSMAQRAAPRGARTASALTMGFASGLGGVAGPVLVWLARDNTIALLVAAGALLPAAALAMTLPRHAEPQEAKGTAPLLSSESRL